MLQYMAPEMEMKALEVEDILMSNEETKPTTPIIPEFPDDER